MCEHSSVPMNAQYMSLTVNQIVTGTDKKEWLSNWPMQHTIFFQKSERESKGTIIDVAEMEIWCEFPDKSVRPNDFYDVVLRMLLVKGPCKELLVRKCKNTFSQFSHNPYRSTNESCKPLIICWKYARLNISIAISNLQY